MSSIAYFSSNVCWHFQHFGFSPFSSLSDRPWEKCHCIRISYLTLHETVHLCSFSDFLRQTKICSSLHCLIRKEKLPESSCGSAENSWNFCHSTQDDSHLEWEWSLVSRIEEDDHKQMKIEMQLKRKSSHFESIEWLGKMLNVLEHFKRDFDLLFSFTKWSLSSSPFLFHCAFVLCVCRFDFRRNRIANSTQSFTFSSVYRLLSLEVIHRLSKQTLTRNDAERWMLNQRHSDVHNAKDKTNEIRRKKNKSKKNKQKTKAKLKRKTSKKNVQSETRELNVERFLSSFFGLCIYLGEPFEVQDISRHSPNAYSTRSIPTEWRATRETKAEI